MRNDTATNANSFAHTFCSRSNQHSNQSCKMSILFSSLRKLKTKNLLSLFKQKDGGSKEVSYMSTIKESVISIVKEMPENATLEDIMESLYVKQKIIKGQSQLESGQFYTHEEAKEILKEWIKLKSSEN